MQDYMPLDLHEVPSGTKVFDWTVPPEWELISGELRDSAGNVVLSSAQNPMHVVNFSEPFTGKVTREQLEEHLFYRSTNASFIPYVISYYKPRWGFCLSKEQYSELNDSEYYVDIKCRKYPGALVYGRCVLPGKSKRKITLTTYLCHPNMLNNELSGPLALIQLYHLLAALRERQFTYEFIVNPETIGSISLLHDRPDFAQDLEFGIVLTCLADKYDAHLPLTVKLSRADWLANLNTPYAKLPIVSVPTNDAVDKAAKQVEIDKLHREYFERFKDSLDCAGNSPYSIDRFVRELSTLDREFLNLRLFSPTSGSDERQYCSPQLNLPFIQIARTEYLTYPEYHTASDNAAIFDIDSIERSAHDIFLMLQLYELNRYYLGENVAACEPQLGKRDLYPTINVSGRRSNKTDKAEISVEHVLTALSLLDGTRTLLQLAKIAKLNPYQTFALYERLSKGGILTHSPIQEANLA